MATRCGCAAFDRQRRVCQGSEATGRKDWFVDSGAAAVSSKAVV